MQSHASGLIRADFTESFVIAQENWTGATEDEIPWAMGAAATRCMWYIQQLQKAVSRWLLHQGKLLMMLTAHPLDFNFCMGMHHAVLAGLQEGVSNNSSSR